MGISNRVLLMLLIAFIILKSFSLINCNVRGIARLETGRRTVEPLLGPASLTALASCFRGSSGGARSVCSTHSTSSTRSRLAHHRYGCAEKRHHGGNERLDDVHDLTHQTIRSFFPSSRAGGVDFPLVSEGLSEFTRGGAGGEAVLCDSFFAAPPISHAAPP
jgi:hypothetical protein